MKHYKMSDTDRVKGFCWKYCLACLLNIPPCKVPQFNGGKSLSQADTTRKWLKKKFNKGLVWIPIRDFLETTELRDNPHMGPDGYSILILEILDNPEIQHAVIAKDGKMHFDPGEIEPERIAHPIGYYIIYDL